jgi:hypothetical protein
LAEDFATDWTEQDASGWLATSPNTKITAVNQDRDDLSQFELAKSDMATGLSWDFTMYVDDANCVGSYYTSILGVHNQGAGKCFIDIKNGGAGTYGIMCRTSTSNLRFYRLKDGAATIGGMIAPIYYHDLVRYCTFYHSGGSWYLAVYSDAARTSHVPDSPVSVAQDACTPAAMDYVIVIAGHDDGTGGVEFDGYIEDFDFNEAVAAGAPRLIEGALIRGGRLTGGRLVRC